MNVVGKKSNIKNRMREERVVAPVSTHTNIFVFGNIRAFFQFFFVALDVFHHQVFPGKLKMVWEVVDDSFLRRCMAIQMEDTCKLTIK